MIIVDILTMKTLKGLALQDLLTELYEFVRYTQFPANTKVFLVETMGEIEQRLNAGCDEKIQLGALVSVFQAGKEIAVKGGA